MQRMSGLDASFLYLETPAMPMHVGLLVIIDPASKGARYDYAEVFRLIEAAAHGQPALSLQVAEVPFHLDHPRWVKAADLDVLHHVRRVSCPGSGTRDDLCGVVDRALATPLDRARPLWEVWVIEGLAGGKYALLAKVHHALADGVAGMQIMAALFAGERAAGAASAARASLPANDTAQAESEHVDPFSLLRDGVRSRLGLPREVFRMLKRTQVAIEGLLERRRSDPSRHGGTLLQAPRAPWNQPITRERITVLAEVRTDDIRDARKALGVSANDVLLGICAGALRRYLLRHHTLPETALTAACPIAARVDEHTRNRISALVINLATDMDDPIARVHAIARSAAAARDEHSSFGADMLASWAELSAPGFVRGAVRLYGDYGVSAHHPPLYNLSISNVPGPRKPLHFAGGNVVATYPLGPVVDGIGLNITMLNYAGVYGLGLVAARAAFPDLAELTSDIAASVAEINSASAGLRTRRPALEKR